MQPQRRALCLHCSLPGARRLQLHLERWRERSTQPGQEDAAPSLQPLGTSSTILSSAQSELGPELGADNDSEVERTHLLVTHLAQEIDALGGQQERYGADCEALSLKNARLWCTSRRRGVGERAGGRASGRAGKSDALQRRPRGRRARAMRAAAAGRRRAK